MEYETTTNENVIDRLNDELEDLNGKIERLKAFEDSHYNGFEFTGDIGGDCYAVQHKAIGSQLSNMIGYSRALKWRIEILQTLKWRIEILQKCRQEENNNDIAGSRGHRNP